VSKTYNTFAESKRRMRFYGNSNNTVWRVGQKKLNSMEKSSLMFQ
jgi:hypothetical protein